MMKSPLCIETTFSERNYEICLWPRYTTCASAESFTRSYTYLGAVDGRARGVRRAHPVPTAVAADWRVHAAHGWHVVVGLVHGQALLDVGRERTMRTLVHARRPGGVVSVVPVQVPFVRRSEVAVRTLDHGHRVVFDVFRVPGPHVRHVVTLHAPEKLLLQVRRLLVPVDQRLAVAAERAHRTPDERGRGHRGP